MVAGLHRPIRMPNPDRWLRFLYQEQEAGVNAYVIMPTHLHAIVFDREFHVERLKQTLDDLRKFTGRKLLDHSAKHLPECFAEVFRSHAGEDRQRRFWQATQHPVGTFSEGSWKQKFDYLHQNPCRKGLVVRPEDWRFSSALYWNSRERGNLPVSEAEWEWGFGTGGLEDQEEGVLRAGRRQGQAQSLRSGVLPASPARRANKSLPVWKGADLVFTFLLTNATLS